MKSRTLSETWGVLVIILLMFVTAWDSAVALLLVSGLCLALGLALAGQRERRNIFWTAAIAFIAAAGLALIVARR